MLFNSKTGVWLAVGLAALATAAPSAKAGCNVECPCVSDVDIDWLHARLYQGCAGWHLYVQYDIEIECTYPGQYQLEVTLSEKGWPLLSKHSRPLEIVQLLDETEEINDGDCEHEYEGCFTVAMPHALVRHGKDVKVLAKVVARCSGSVVNFVSKPVDYRPGKFMCACEACKQNCGACPGQCGENCGKCGNDCGKPDAAGEAEQASANCGTQQGSVRTASSSGTVCEHSASMQMQGCKENSSTASKVEGEPAKDCPHTAQNRGDGKVRPASAKSEEAKAQCKCTARRGKCTCDCLKCLTDCKR